MIYKNGQPLDGKIKWGEVLRHLEDADIFVATIQHDYSILSSALRRNFYTFLSGKYAGKYVARIIAPELFKELKNYA